MWKALGFGLLVLAGSAGAASAQGVCGDSPIAPLVPAAADIKQKSPADAETAKHNAFAEIRRWQGALKSYRDCLVANINTDKRKLGEAQRADKPDQDKIKGLDGDITASNQAYDASTDEEERVVNDFNAASVAYCMRTDVNRATCPKT